MVAVNYLWNPINDNIIEEFDDAGTTIAEYTTEPDLYGNVVSQFRNGQTSYLLSDGQGNTTELTNDAGNVTDTIRYSAFGEVTQRTGTTEIPFQYVGQRGYYRDGFIAEHAVRRRMLICTTSRWLSEDPIADGLRSQQPFRASYSYAGNNPLGRIDPSGLFDCSDTDTTQYSCKCGWIDWNHAGYSDDFAREFQKLLKGTGKASLLSRGNQFCFEMTHGLGPIRYGPGRRCYWVERELSVSQYEAIALAIYQEVAEEFETWQGVWFGFPPRAPWSSYSCEDLPSNLLQFYRSIRGWKKREDLTEICQVVTDSDLNTKLCDFTECIGCPKVRTWPPSQDSPCFLNVYKYGPCQIRLCDYPCPLEGSGGWPDELSVLKPSPKGIHWGDWTIQILYVPPLGPPGTDEQVWYDPPMTVK